MHLSHDQIVWDGQSDRGVKSISSIITSIGWIGESVGVTALFTGSGCQFGNITVVLGEIVTTTLLIGFALVANDLSKHTHFVVSAPFWLGSGGCHCISLHTTWDGVTVETASERVCARLTLLFGVDSWAFPAGWAADACNMVDCVSIEALNARNGLSEHLGALEANWAVFALVRVWIRILS